MPNRPAPEIESLPSHSAPSATSDQAHSPLAVYAQRQSDRGRERNEDPHPFRTDFQRDRDRIVHSKSFRRLEYKTQVFLNGAGDHYRTRMTHTMEVSCIARTMARALQLNEDLVEAIALAHDLGHPPFGHLGESVLHQLMTDHGGFKHNPQSVRVVEELEMKYPEFNGLNLSWEVREGLHKPYPSHRFGPDFIQPCLEAQVVDLSDQVAYICHDLDDGLDSGLLVENELRELPLWHEIETAALKPYPKLEPERGRNYVLRCLLGRLADDVIIYSKRLVAHYAPDSPDAVRRIPRIIRFSPDLEPRAKELLQFLYQRLYHHPTIKEINQRCGDCLTQLFDLFIHKPHLLNPRFEVRVKKDGLHRATCDYLACQTDRQIYLLHEQFIGGTPVLLSSRLKQTAFSLPLQP